MNRKSDLPPWDRYKMSSYRAYNFKLPNRYDSAIAVKICRVGVMDNAVLEEVGAELPSLSVLDVGCATGRLLCRLAEKGARKLAGCDLAPRILDTAREKLARYNQNVELRPADCEDVLPWESESFDVVTLTGVLHHFSNPKAALSEIRRVLRKSGRLIVVEAGFFTPVRQLFNLFLKLHPHEGDYHFYTCSEAKKLFLGSQWNKTSSRRLNPIFYILAAVKN